MKFYLVNPSNPAKTEKTSRTYYVRTRDKSGSNSPPFQGNVQILPFPGTMHSQMPRGGGMLKFRIDRRITNWLIKLIYDEVAIWWMISFGLAKVTAKCRTGHYRWKSFMPSTIFHCKSLSSQTWLVIAWLTERWLSDAMSHCVILRQNNWTHFASPVARYIWVPAYWAVIPCVPGAVCDAIQSGSNFWVCGWHPRVWSFKRKRLSSTFLWYCLSCSTR